MEEPSASSWRVDEVQVRRELTMLVLCCSAVFAC